MNTIHLLKYIGLAGLMGLIGSAGNIKHEIMGGTLIIIIIVLDVLDLKRVSKVDGKK